MNKARPKTGKPSKPPGPKPPRQEETEIILNGLFAKHIIAIVNNQIIKEARPKLPYSSSIRITLLNN